MNDALPGFLAGSPAAPVPELQEVTKVWETRTPTRVLYIRTMRPDRAWQHHPETPVKYVFLTEPIPGHLRKPAFRNFKRLFARAGFPKPTWFGYPATAGREPHWADVSGLETVEDRKKARNAMRRKRQGR